MAWGHCFSIMIQQLATWRQREQVYCKIATKRGQCSLWEEYLLNIRWAPQRTRRSQGARRRGEGGVHRARELGQPRWRGCTQMGEKFKDEEAKKICLLATAKDRCGIGMWSRNMQPINSRWWNCLWNPRNNLNLSRLCWPRGKTTEWWSWFPWMFPQTIEKILSFCTTTEMTKPRMAAPARTCLATAHHIALECPSCRTLLEPKKLFHTKNKSVWIRGTRIKNQSRGASALQDTSRVASTPPSQLRVVPASMTPCMCTQTINMTTLAVLQCIVQILLLILESWKCEKVFVPRSGKNSTEDTKYHQNCIFREKNTGKDKGREEVQLRRRGILFCEMAKPDSDSGPGN